MTDAGMLDVHVLTVDLTDAFLRVGPAESLRGLGFKESATNLLRDNGAVAGVNADFFGLAGAYSVPFGPVADRGQLRAINTSTNYRRNEFAAFFIDDNNNPFMGYMKATINFMVNGQNIIEISSFNKAGADFRWAVAVDKQYMDNTSNIDSRFEGLYKIVVDGGMIT